MQIAQSHDEISFREMEPEVSYVDNKEDSQQMMTIPSNIDD